MKVYKILIIIILILLVILGIRMFVEPKQNTSKKTYSKEDIQEILKKADNISNYEITITNNKGTKKQEKFIKTDNKYLISQDNEFVHIQDFKNNQEIVCNVKKKIYSVINDNELIKYGIQEAMGGAGINISLPLSQFEKTEKINGKDTIKVSEPNSTLKNYYWIDINTGLIVKQEKYKDNKLITDRTATYSFDNITDKTIEKFCDYSNYKKVDNVYNN